MKRLLLATAIALSLTACTEPVAPPVERPTPTKPVPTRPSPIPTTTTEPAPPTEVTGTTSPNN